jgi:hypothetical protein
MIAGEAAKDVEDVKGVKDPEGHRIPGSSEVAPWWTDRGQCTTVTHTLDGRRSQHLEH